MADVELSVIQPARRESAPSSSPPPSPHEEATPNDDEDDDSTESWPSRSDHLAMLLGVAIGLGHVLQSPYFYYAIGGGAYFLAYLLLLVLFGFPLLLLESFIGQFSSSTAIGVYSSFPAFKGVGITSCVVLLLNAPSVAVSTGIPVLFVGYSFIYIDKWGSCDNYWNSEYCSDMANGSYYESSIIFMPAMEFYERVVLQAPSVGLSWHLSLAALLVWALVFFALFSGVRALGKIMWVIGGCTLVLFTLFFLYGVTLPGALEGIGHMFYFGAHKLLDHDTWVTAASQILFTYLFGFGFYTTMSSFNKFRHSFVRDALVVTLTSVAMELLAGITVCSIFGFFAREEGFSVHDFVSTGEYLIYGTLPQAFSKMNQPAFCSCVFYLTAFLLALSTFIVYTEVLVECILTVFRRWRSKRWLLVLALCIAGFLFSLAYCSKNGLGWISYVDGFSGIITSPTICLLEVIVFVYIYGAGRLARDVEMLSNVFLSYYCYFTWIFTTPLVLVILLVSRLLLLIETTEYYDTQIGVYLLAFSPSMIIPIYSLCYVLRNDCCKKLQFQETPWEPRAASNKSAWKLFCSQRPVRRSLVHRTF
ncbi:sodium- and chloride-dependent glycine transporter 2-like [Penaeus japonicus]|uniref:sodium- and chloride-dependent glycine transporter 2-like n=1 Tax=Penaeus japonicus TaxID=27405 RepID=UPI001C711F40|nr:sodium- and chloride-dependent glycine transporter 2-like [Penaeus japonicus]XP_042886845.1 sodium- and chloride-dependent glycine transporter 2-like [Penaeus japonicus]